MNKILLRAAAVILVAMASGPVLPAGTQLYWGDTHLHTPYSVDACATGNHVTDPDAAFRYARERIRWESVMEAAQTKGTSEIVPPMSLNDEFAGFEMRNKLLVGTPAKVTAASFARIELQERAWSSPIGYTP